MNDSYLSRTSIGIIVIALSFLLFPTIIFAQHSREISLSNGQHVRIDNSKGGFYSVITKNGKIESVLQENPDQVVHVIVTFRDRPLAAYKVKKLSLQKTAMASVYSALQTGHSSFRTALNTIRQQLSAQLKSDYSYTIKREYYRALNGVALTCKRGMITRIRSLPMVEYVTTDGEVKANLEQSVRQIRADIVQDSLGLTGKGVLVGDVDTGIDYDNPALGGGFGPGFRVIGGYDFANNDNDPMDDHGHGTHVAGIIGANSGDTLRGVAPDVKFLAVKVLDADGSGLMSTVIAGIDYCLDPDGNPATDDAVDVVNMSLGGQPIPENPVDSAVEYATKAGVLCVVAAGNSGFGSYGTIGSPGTSESALTVGACDSAYHMADFSSIGPDPIHSFIKPEVVAPGVNILSTILNNQTASWSGTSMATPHVTGTAALLKQEHPLWTPEEIKAAIVNTAHSIGDTVSVFVQGKGCIDALDAANTRMVVEPGVLSFGYADLSQSVWIDTVIMKVANFRSVSQNTNVSIVNGPPDGATLAFDKTSFTLGPGEETTIKAILTVPSSVPVLSEEPFAYLGNIRVTSDSDNVIVPFSFLKSTTLVITLDMPTILVYLLDRTGTYTKRLGFNGETKFVVPVPKGVSLELLAEMIEEDTLGFYNLYTVLRTIGIPTGFTYVPVSHNEATINASDDTIYSVQNKKILLGGFEEVSHEWYLPRTGYSFELTIHFYFRLSADGGNMFFSPLDSSFYLSKQIIALSDSSCYILDKATYGIHNRQDFVPATGAGNLFCYHVSASYNDALLANPSGYTKEFIIGSNRATITPGGTSAGGLELDDYPSNSNFYFNIPDEMSEPINGRFHYSSHYFGLGMVTSISGSTPVEPPKLLTPNFTVTETGQAVFGETEVAISSLGPLVASNVYDAFTYETKNPGDTMKIEQYAHLSFPDYSTSLRRGSLYMGTNSSNDFSQLFEYFHPIRSGIKQGNGVQEHIADDDPYYYWPRFTTQLFRHNRLQINSEPFVASVKRDAFYRFDNMNGLGTLRVLSDAHPYALLGQAGQCTADFQFTIRTSSDAFPSFRLLQVAVDGKAVDNVRPDQNGKVRLILSDLDSSITSATISLIPASGNEITLPVSSSGALAYDASIPSSLPEGFMDVVVRAEDRNGNRCELTASPGFYFGSTLDSARSDARLRMNSYSLDNVEAIQMQIGDTLKYALSYANYGNGIARNVRIVFPTTPSFKPIGATSCTMDSIGVNDTVHIPVNLEFLGKQQSTDEYSYYAPAISWISSGISYQREHKMLVDFQKTITDVAHTSSPVPRRFELYQNFPNPFNPSTTIKYDLPKESRVKIVVYDVLGREVARLADEMKKAGSYQVVWDANRLASGVYFYRIQAGNYSATKKLLLLK